MQIRLTCNISQEQIDEGYDYTLMNIHHRFVKWLVELDIPITAFSLFWEEMDDGEPYLFATANLCIGSEVEIDKKFLDELHLGGKEDG